MNFRTTIILCVVMLLAVGYLFYDRLGNKTDQTTETSTPDTKGRKIVDVKRDDVTRISIKQGGGTIELSKVDGNWKITKPVNWQADSFEVGTVIDGLLELRSQGRVPSGESASTGLDKPRSVIEITTRDDKKTTLAIGKRFTLGNALYVQVAGSDTMQLAAAGKLNDTADLPVAKIVSNLRDKSVFAGTNSMDVKQLEIKRNNATFVFNKNSAGDWQMVFPQQMPADETEVGDLVRTITGLRADSFVEASSSELANARLDQPRVTAWFSKDAPSTQPSATTTASTMPAAHTGGVSVAFGGYEFGEGSNQKVYIQVSNPAVVVKSDITQASWDKLAKSAPLDLRDRRLIDLTPGAVNSLVITSDLVATTQPTTRPASHNEVTLGRKTDSGESIKLGAAPGKGVAAPTTTTAPATTQASTEPALPPTHWQIRGKTPADAEEAKVETLLSALHPLRVNKYVDPAGPATRPSATHRLFVMTVAAGGETKTYDLVFVDPGDGKPLVGTYEGLRFEVDRDLISKLEGDWKNKPKAPEPPPMPNMGPGGGFPGMPMGPMEP